MSGVGPHLRRGFSAAAIGFVLLTAALGAVHGAPTRFLVIDTAGGLVFAVAGIVAWERRPEVWAGPVLVASAALWSVGSYAPMGLMPWTVLGFAFERYYDLLLAFLVLSFPQARLTRGDRLLLGVMASAFLVRTLSRLLVQCDCTGVQNPFAIVTAPSLFEQAQIWTSVVITGAASVVALRAVVRLVLARPAVRRILWPVVGSGGLAAVVAAYDALDLVVFVRTGAPVLRLAEPWQEVVSWTITATVVLIALGFMAGVLRMRLQRGVVARMAVDLDRDSSPRQIREALRHALGDSKLELYLRRVDGSWVDTLGAPVPRPTASSDCVVSEFGNDEGLLGAVVHDAALREDPDLMTAVVALLRFALENEQLAATVLEQLEEVRASRARLVRAGAEERQRLERDLHDGAQQRLVGVALQLQQAREEAMSESVPGGLVSSLGAVAAELEVAIAELRELARGIHPAVLTEDGLRPAVTALARRATIPVDVDVDLTERLDPAVEAAVYFIVAEALTNVVRHAGATSATVRICRSDGCLQVEVSDDGTGGVDPSRGSGVEGMGDRLDALAGNLQVHSPIGGGTRLRADIPCG